MHIKEIYKKTMKNKKISSFGISKFILYYDGSYL